MSLKFHLVASMISIVTVQTYARSAQIDASMIRQRDITAEDRVAHQIDHIRKEKGLKPLERVAPSLYEARLACSVSATGKPLSDVVQRTSTSNDLFQTFRVPNLTDQTAELLFLATDIELTKKEFPHFSVVVFKDAIDPKFYVIGVSREEGKVGHWWGCSALNMGRWLEDGCTDHGVPKPLIAPECETAGK